MKSPLLSLCIIAGNEEKMIGDCLRSGDFADEVILVTTPSCTDTTAETAKKTIPQIKISKFDKFPDTDFSAWRNAAFNLAHSKWILFIDADERITPDLKKEILQIISQPEIPFTNYDLPRANFFLGKRVKHGGTYPDYVKRLFLREKFKGYQGKLHEQPLISGPGSQLKSDLLHYTHRDLSSMLSKSLEWTTLEAEMLYKSKHPPVVWWRLLRMMSTKFWQRFIWQSMWLDGTVGLISSIYESFDTFIIYARLYEIQQQS